jgi:hypothetical protein
MKQRLRGLAVIAVLAPAAVHLNGCNNESNGTGNADGTGGANPPDVDMVVVAPSFGKAVGFAYEMDSPFELELEEGKWFWVSAAGSFQPVKLIPNLGLDSEFFFLLSSLQDTLDILAGRVEQAADNRYYIAYNGDGSVEGASFFTVPPPFQVTAPLSHETVSVVNDLEVNWDAPDNIEEVVLVAAIVCSGFTDEAQWHVARPGNTGSHTISGGWYMGGFRDGAEPAESCDLTIQIAAGREGTTGFGFDNSEVMGYRISSVTLTATE